MGGHFALFAYRVVVAKGALDQFDKIARYLYKFKLASADACEYRHPKKAPACRTYQVGLGRPPLHTRFKKGRSGNPGGRRAKSLPALLAAALDETVCVTTNGRRRKFTKSEAIINRMVDKSASADLRATKMLIDMMQAVEKKARAAAPPLAEADEEVVQQLVARLRRQVLPEIEEGKTAALLE